MIILLCTGRLQVNCLHFEIFLYIEFLYAGLQTGRIMVWWCPSVRPSAHFLHFSHTCFDIMSWNFAHDFVLMYYRSSLSVVTLRQFLYARRDVLWYGDVRQPSGYPSARFPHFSPTCFDILSWNFAHDFVLIYYRSSLSVINLRQVLLELCPFWNLEYWKYSFPHFSLTCFDMLSWNFAYDFVLLYYRSSSSVVNFRQFLWELCPFWNLNYWKYTVFRTFLLHALTYWAEILHMTLFYCTTDQVWVSSISVNFCGSYAPFGT